MCEMRWCGVNSIANQVFMSKMYAHINGKIY